MPSILIYKNSCIPIPPILPFVLIVLIPFNAFLFAIICVASIPSIFINNSAVLAKPLHTDKLSISAPSIKKLLNFAHKIIYKFNQEKADSFKAKVEVQLEEYHDSAKFIIDNKNAMVKTFLASIGQLVSYHSVAYFIYLSLGVEGLNYIKITSLQSFLYLSVSVLPLPGTVGVNETGFSLLYNPIIKKTIVDSAMLLTRGISFYLIVLITGIILLYIALKKNPKKK